MTYADFSDKTVLITGGSSGIGLHCARELRAQGARVIVTGRNADKLADIAGSYDLEWIRCDQSKPAEIDALRDRVGQQFEQLDVLFANAGVAPFAHVRQMPLEQIDQVLDVNVRGTFLTVRAFMDMMSAGGSVILNSSAIADKGIPGYTLYSASKSAIRAFARTFAAELSSKGIRVNSLSPGPIHNEAFLEQDIAPEDRERLYDTILRRVPLAREGTMAEVVKAVLFLASAQSSYMTGADLQIDGGFSQV
ncbi:MAG: SDR family oxidoreductase [Pseudomonadota bacterium]